MATITNPSSQVSIFQDLINYILTDSDDSIFNELASDSTLSTEPQENQGTSSKGLKRTIDYLDQPAAKKSLVSNPSTSSPENSVTMSSTSKKELVDSINQIYEKASTSSFEKIQIHYANQLDVDLEEIKSIYLAVSTHCSTANKTSVINTKTSLSVKNSVIIPPEFKKELVNAINRNFNKIKTSHLEQIQTYYAKQLKLDLQEIKSIYFFVSPHDSATEIVSNELKPLDLKLKVSSTETILIISPAAKKNLADNITYLFHTTDVSLEEIQTRYAKQFKIAPQDIEDIYLAISTNGPSANEPSEIKQIGSFKDPM